MSSPPGTGADLPWEWVLDTQTLTTEYLFKQLASMQLFETTETAWIQTSHQASCLSRAYAQAELSPSMHSRA
ncbi:MAG: hypothetical protein QMB32_08940 [Burkholderiaceae bacterium]